MAAAVREKLAALGQVVYGPFDEQALATELQRCNILMVRLGRFIGADVLAPAPMLKFIVTATTGLDHIDMDSAQRANIRVVSLRDCTDEIADVSSTAEHTWGLLLALVRRTPWAIAHVLDGGWDRDRFWGTQLREKQLGVIGFGRLGKRVASYGEAFGMRVVAYDKDPHTIEAPATPVSLEMLLESSDVVTVHATANSENRHLLDASNLARLKAGAFVVNTARGRLVEEAALARLVEAGKVAGVAVDVLDGEEHGTSKSSPLLRCARDGYNVLITPHIGGATTEAIARAELAVVEQLGKLV